MPHQSDKSPNTLWHRATVTRQRREQKNAHKSIVLWFTGLSGSGKSTLAHAVEERLCSDLGFSDTDRKENIRRVSETTKLLLEAA